MPGRSSVAVAAAFAALAAAAAAPSQAGRAAACPSLASAARLPLWPSGRTLRHDLDGDGRVDVATVRWSPSAPLSCAFLVTVRHGGVTSAAVAHGFQNTVPAREWTGRQPTLEAVVDLGGPRPLLAVGLEEGASTLTVALFRLDRTLHELPVGTSRVVTLFGSAGTGSTTAHCSRGGPLVLLTVWPAGPRWAFSTRTYTLLGARLPQTGITNVYGSEGAIDRKARAAGYNAAQFAGCSLARVKDAFRW